MHRTDIKTDEGNARIFHNGDWSGDARVLLFLHGEKATREFEISGWLLKAVAKEYADSRLGDAIVNLIEQWEG